MKIKWKSLRDIAIAIILWSIAIILLGLSLSVAISYQLSAISF